MKLNVIVLYMWVPNSIVYELDLGAHILEELGQLTFIQVHVFIQYFLFKLKMVVMILNLRIPSMILELGTNYIDF